MFWNTLGLCCSSLDERMHIFHPQSRMVTQENIVWWKIYSPMVKQGYIKSKSLTFAIFPALSVKYIEF